MTASTQPRATDRKASPEREDLIALVRTGATPGLGVTRHGSRSRDTVAIEACVRCLLRSLLRVRR